jgi:hypothetical protein
MVFALRALPNGDLSKPELDSNLRDMSSAISDFGACSHASALICSSIHVQASSWTFITPDWDHGSVHSRPDFCCYELKRVPVRYKRSPELKEMLSNFCEKFWTIEGELGSNSIAAQFETGQTSAIQTSISTLINRIGGASSAAQKRALEKIVHGRNSLEVCGENSLFSIDGPRKYPTEPGRDPRGCERTERIGHLQHSGGVECRFSHSPGGKSVRNSQSCPGDIEPTCTSQPSLRVETSWHDDDAGRKDVY